MALLLATNRKHHFISPLGRQQVVFSKADQEFFALKVKSGNAVTCPNANGEDKAKVVDCDHGRTCKVI